MSSTGALRRALQGLCRASLQQQHSWWPPQAAAGQHQLSAQAMQQCAGSSSGFSSLASLQLRVSSNSSLCIHHHRQQQHVQCSSQQRSFADASGAGGPARVGRQRRRPTPHQHQQQQQQQASSGGGGGGRWQQQQQPRELSELQLGRQAVLCVPTEKLREPHFIGSTDPWRDRSRAAMEPRQVDGSYGDDIEDVLLMRQQLENSALPNEFKRSRLISPAWDDVLLQVNRTVKVTKGGKVETLHALVAVGNNDGLIGIGEHSGKNIQKVMLDAQLKAYRNLVAIPRYRKHTVYHPIDLKNRKVRIQVWPRSAGFGITASPLMTQLSELAGFKDLTIKLTGRRKNIRNAVQTFVAAMSAQSLPHDGVEGSGVYVRERVGGRDLGWGLKRGVDVP